MRRFLIPGVVSFAAIAFILVLAVGIHNEKMNSSVEWQVQHGRHPVAPNANLPLAVLNSSAKASLSDYRGKVVLLNMFASWCVPCAQESSVVERAQRLLAQHDGTVLGVTYEDNAPDDVAFMRQHHLTFPVVRDVNGSFANAYGIDGVPDTFVINRQGRVMAFNLYPITNQWVDQTLTKIIDEPS
jgi:cytochrome c biogenesis protein CcmG, thiol:disulfide interchange protein DsbE